MAGRKSQIKTKASRSPKNKQDGTSLVDCVDQFEDAIVRAAYTQEEGECFVLKLYVTGSTPRSMAAIQNIRKLCEQHLQGRYDLEVIDIYQQPVLAKGEQIIAAPTLIKKLPIPLRKVVGDLSNAERVLMGIDVIRK